MAKRRRAFREVQDIVDLNQALAQVLKTLPALEEEVADEMEEDFSDLVISLHTLQLWLKRVGAITPTELPAALFRFRGIADSIYEALRTREASALSPGLRVRLASLGKQLLQFSRMR